MPETERFMIVKSIRPMSLAKLSSALYAVLGLPFSVFVAVHGVARSFVVPDGFQSATRIATGMAIIVAVPIVYGAFGFVVSLLAASLYNVVAGRIGGIQINVERIDAPPPK